MGVARNLSDRLAVVADLSTFATEADSWETLQTQRAGYLHTTSLLMGARGSTGFFDPGNGDRQPGRFFGQVLLGGEAGTIVPLRPALLVGAGADVLFPRGASRGIAPGPAHDLSSEWSSTTGLPRPESRIRATGSSSGSSSARGWAEDGRSAAIQRGSYYSVGSLESPALPPGTRIGPYEIEARIGAGGMGEVYRATDVNLKRRVALKVLPSWVAGDPDRLARFQREAEMLAALNHPNIASIYGVEPAAGHSALVMELVDGPTLAERIARGPLPVDEALDIARQIAVALEAAHERGIVHRDLKPANVKVRPDGTVKVLDFGLAKPIDTAPAGGEASDASTVTISALTQAGVVLGTAAYMSPEQARGEPVDARADIWAFGCVLFEALTGRRAFEGRSLQDVLAAVLTAAPDWSRLPPALPRAVRVLLERCLARDRRQRVRHIGTAVLLLDRPDAFSTPGRSAAGASRSRGLIAVAGASLLAGAGLAAGAMWLSRPSVEPRVVRTTIEADTFLTGTDRNFAFTPDGRRLVYISGDSRRILVRSLDSLEPKAIVSTAAYLRSIFPSPDGQWVGFIQNNFTLRKAPSAGGPATTLLQIDGPSRGASWGPDDTIVFATGAADTGLQQVSASGGPVTILTRPDPARREADHLNPAWLPDGRGVLFTIRHAEGGIEAASVGLLDVKTRTWRTLIEHAFDARYVDGGYLVYAAGDALWTIRFDLGRQRVDGTPVEALRPVHVRAPGALASFDVSPDGTLAYPLDVASDDEPLMPVWVDRGGRETPLDATPNVYREPRLSPDGRRVAVAVAGDLFVWEVGRPWATASRMTFDHANNWYPV